MKNTQQTFSRRMLQLMGLGTMCTISAFVLGMQSAGEVQTIASLNASGTIQRGDVNLDGVVDKSDVEEILEIARGHKEPSPHQLRADPNGDGEITIDDALELLKELERD